MIRWRNRSAQSASNHSASPSDYLEKSHTLSQNAAMLFMRLASRRSTVLLPINHAQQLFHGNLIWEYVVSAEDR